jgi:LysR family nitrogen assimilation transcriptional regulator
MAGELMDVKQLKALVTVVEAGSVTRAAELLHLVQPAVTRQIRALEQELGVPLFERTRHGMRPTAPAPGIVTGLVDLGLLESTVELLAEPLVSAVRRDHPGIELRVLTAYSGHLQQWLDDGDLDVSLLYNLRSTPSLNVQALVREMLWVVAPASDGLSADHPVPLEIMTAHPVIMPAPGHALRALIDQAAAQAQVKIDVAVQTNSMNLQKQLVRRGHGWTILPGAGVAADLAAGVLSAAPLSEPEVWRSIVVGVPRTGPITPAAQVVAAQLTRQVKIAVRQGWWPSAELYEPGGG